jgi:fumarate reductase flavoprotein subunit
VTWHDWLNLKSLILVSRAITASSLAREESRGAHFRSDFPATAPNDDLAFTTVALRDGAIVCDREAVRFTRIKPGETLLGADAA